MPSDLITQAEYLAFTSQALADVDPTDLARINETIPGASAAVRGFTNRNFVLASEDTQGTRNYRYDGYGTIEIDDAAVINSVSTVATSFAVSRTLDPTEWFALAEGDTPIIDYIEFYTRFLATGLSPEMGFKRNLDTMPYVPYPTMITVDAQWGWPEIPHIVKQATVWAVETFINFKGQSPLNSQAIASFSQSFNQFQPRGRMFLLTNALPEQAIAVLEPYMRITV